MPKVPDEKIVELFNAGKFIRQICNEQHVGIRRVRAVLDVARLRKGQVS
jgi:hypothetical protein